MNYTVRKRKNREGQKCIAPFINGWNVWDIPEKEWTKAVQDAVMHAYILGRRHALDEARNAVSHVQSSPEDCEWKEEK